MPEKIEIRETQEQPLCPFCEKKLSTILWHKVREALFSPLGYVAIYSCPNCKKVLGISDHSSS